MIGSPFIYSIIQRRSRDFGSGGGLVKGSASLWSEGRSSRTPKRFCKFAKNHFSTTIFPFREGVHYVPPPAWAYAIIYSTIPQINSLFWDLLYRDPTKSIFTFRIWRHHEIQHSNKPSVGDFLSSSINNAYKWHLYLGHTFHVNALIGKHN